ncbi:TPA_asm: TlpA family protein disulfide reductase [Campylobacter jejuni]|uniref:TlpA disulfide reductase family protein n=1 Tax=Campylobacter jejuni TaxID=197 RepID=UPI00126B467A|nr:TlpA disulfide reductase family protein [Campylobacter jejuni]EAI3538447.1 TlpA family protein disulfide reductase [Campylobacter jejuni]EAJ8404174.1 TlpA family protein disulfide reductase [Campylobacter jejuni]EAM0092846.1 TlpA family protein disulfide reductase [Campylobacter jejuni]EAV9565609.1 TlpA family protein disulfide reductase [Campylobacter jejuni]ECL4582168.1 TlpA family protein disulfide reductase [Campylobacter jejuni]
MKKILTLFLISLAFFLNACSKEEEIQNDFMFEEYHKEDKIVLNSVNGGSKTLIRTDKGFVVEGEEGKVLMFDFFGTFCTPCKEEALDLSKLWKNNSSKFIIIGLTHFEDVSDETVKKFADDYGAYYFLSNGGSNDRIIAQILKDIDYQNMEQLPFKVVLKNGIYQKISDYWNNNAPTNFYLGKIPTELMQEDLNKIYKGK